MQKRFLVLAVPVLALLTGATVGERAAFMNHKIVTEPGCLPQDRIALDLRDGLIDLMGRSSALSDSILKDQGIVRVPTEQISIVSDTTTCRRAAQAYSATVAAADSNRLVDVVRAGIRYVVVDPSFATDSSEWKTAVTFDSSFTQTLRIFDY